MTGLEGRVAFITGGARGIGLGIARACAAAGVKVAVADLDEGALATAAIELGQITEVQAHRLDVSDRAAYARVAAEVHSGLGDVSLLFNNAGVIDSTSPSRISHEMYEWVRGVNMDGVFHGLEQFLPGMVARREGHVVSTASEAGVAQSGSGFLYAMTKYAVVGMSESLRAELGPLGIGVSVLIPGPCATTIVENTRASRPETAPQHSARVTAILSQAHDWLVSNGRSPDDVGTLVLDAVRENRSHIFTRSDLAPELVTRNDGLLAQMQHDHDYLEALADSREVLSR